MKVGLIRKLRLKPGCKYIIFMQPQSFTDEDYERMMKGIREMGCEAVIDIVDDPRKVKVIEEGGEKKCIQ